MKNVSWPELMRLLIREFIDRSILSWDNIQYLVSPLHKSEETLRTTSQCYAVVVILMMDPLILNHEQEPMEERTPLRLAGCESVQMMQLEGITKDR